MATHRAKAEALSARREELRKEAAEATRERIKTVQLTERLQAFALGEKVNGKVVKLTKTELDAIKILFDKTLPNLASVKHEVDAKQVVFLIDTQFDGDADDQVQATG